MVFNTEPHQTIDQSHRTEGQASSCQSSGQVDHGVGVLREDTSGGGGVIDEVHGVDGVHISTSFLLEVLCPPYIIYYKAYRGICQYPICDFCKFFSEIKEHHSSLIIHLTRSSCTQSGKRMPFSSARRSIKRQQLEQENQKAGQVLMYSRTICFMVFIIIVYLPFSVG